MPLEQHTGPIVQALAIVPTLRVAVDTRNLARSLLSGVVIVAPLRWIAR